MTRADSLAERRAYLDGNLTKVECGSCGTVVRARKLSPMQTSVQWTTPSAGACPRLAAAAGDRPAALVPTCPDLRDSLDRAVREGRLEVTG
ncbi:hypothetical protein [Paractinoplanes rishiriensis]|uniref:Ferredoxin n=1 Tax=Paractinoplanes rishiriensis TaxID=1050105 RepID=A0A919JT58_9ACTN|nr:hypothetical protein [Actinoplanes rishiriensis]GIE94350.1 hypothetical protein Ari01nite_18150 [Actinoplanes rishiriensis]